MDDTESSKSIYKTTLFSLLKSVVRFCIRRSIKIQEFEELLKKAYIQEAIDYMKTRTNEVNISKISVITGIQRFAVNELLLSSEKDRPRSGIDLITKIIGAWQTNKKFTRKDGAPKVLCVEGKESEFAELVKSVSTAINPYTILFELERSGLIERSKRSGIKLKYGSNFTNSDINRGLEYYTADFEDLSEAINENLFSGTTHKNHHLTTEFDEILEADREKISKILLSEGSKFHARLRKLLAKFSVSNSDTDQAVRLNKVRVSFCSFSRTHEIYG